MNKICEDCHHLFETDDEKSTKCLECIRSYEQNRQICRNYLQDHQGASISEISRETKIPIKRIKHLIKEGAISYK